MSELNIHEIEKVNPSKAILNAGLPGPDIRLVCVEDGLENIGFRKFAAYIKSIHSKTTIAYVPTGNWRGFIKLMSEKGAGVLTDNDINEVAKFMAEGDIAAFSSMTQYSKTVHEIIAKIRKIKPSTYIVWGGIHAIIHPEDAIEHADAVCTGEGEFAFKTFLNSFKNGKDFTNTSSFWFRKKNGEITKNKNLPLMSPREMDSLPPLLYEDKELIYNQGEGFREITSSDFVKFSGLGYVTIWSVGCPLMCTYCGNSKFIEYDKGYRRLRHSSPRTIIDELKRAISKQPHLSVIAFWDDSFMALPYETLQEFCKIYKEEIKIPFAVYGVIPNYVREDKIALLLDAGMNRIRMGIQSGSENILEFYKRPTKLKRIKESTEILNKFKGYMIPPSFDIILENPVENRDDTLATLDLIYNMPRPFNLNIFALRIIPNTQLAKDIEGKGFDVPSIQKDYITGFHRTMGNALIFLLAAVKIPRWLYNIMRKRVQPVQVKQKKYPVLFFFVRMIYLFKKGYDHLRFMDFSVLPGKPGYYLWKFGIIAFWRRFILRRYKMKSNHSAQESK